MLLHTVLDMLDSVLVAAKLSGSAGKLKSSKSSLTFTRLTLLERSKGMLRACVFAQTHTKLKAILVPVFLK